MVEVKTEVKRENSGSRKMGKKGKPGVQIRRTTLKVSGIKQIGLEKDNPNLPVPDSKKANSKSKEKAVASGVPAREQRSDKRNPDVAPTPTKGGNKGIQENPKTNHPNKPQKDTIVPANLTQSKIEIDLSKITKEDLNNLPHIHSKFADVLPFDKIAYQVLEQKFLRGDETPILYTCKITGKTYLLHDHMAMDIIIKNSIKDFYCVNIDDVNSVEAGVWWMIEHMNSFCHYFLYTRIVIALKALPYFKALGKQNKQLGGKLKKALADQHRKFTPINCLKIIAKYAKCSPTTVNEVRYILRYGTAEDKRKCENGAAISAVQKTVKENWKKSKEYKETYNAAYDKSEYKNPKTNNYINQIICGDNLQIIKDMQYNGVKDIAALITSSMYNVGKDYGEGGLEDSMPHDEYIDKLGHLFYEASKLGRDGMRLINVFPLTTNKHCNKNGDYKYSLLADLIYKIRELNNKYPDCNLRFWGHFNWSKQHSGGAVCQGSLNCASPVLRPDSEYIAVWVKNTNKLENIHGWDCESKKDSPFSESDRNKYIITPDEYYKYTLQTWDIPPVNDHDYRHPARYPEEIPHRLIKLFTYPNDIVLDCFCGSGTTCAVAKKLKRNYIGIDIVPDYCKMSKERCDAVQ